MLGLIVDSATSKTTVVMEIVDYSQGLFAIEWKLRAYGTVVITVQGRPSKSNWYR